jgi:pimeloyl-ACP methyl ester carboxylesterase
MTADEFSMLHENAEEAGLPWHGRPSVRRVDAGPVSALAWGDDDAPAELVLVHGGAQNAHTWDTVALALDRALVAIDLPGHGHSAWRDDHDYRPTTIAPAVADAIAALAPEARLVCGMSLGGLTSLAVAALRPDLVRALALVDITPGVTRHKASDIVAFISGPESFESFDAILERTIQFNPTRSISSLRRGVIHNATEREDGSWAWRYDRFRFEAGDDVDLGQETLWDAVSSSTCPLLVIRGERSPVVDDADIAELRRRRPDAEVVTVAEAGHSIQGDRPVELAHLLSELLQRV